MTGHRRRIVVFGLTGLYLGALGFISGMVVERMRFDVRRTAVLRELSHAERRLHDRLMSLEHQTIGEARSR